eukprot:jgi/Mesen1/3587/ME000020S03116
MTAVSLAAGKSLVVVACQSPEILARPQKNVTCVQAASALSSRASISTSAVAAKLALGDGFRHPTHALRGQQRRGHSIITSAWGKRSASPPAEAEAAKSAVPVKNDSESKAAPAAPAVAEPAAEEEEYEDDEDEEELHWADEKVEDAKEMLETIGERIPGPRVGQSGMPLLVAIPLWYLTASFVWTIYKMVVKFNTPRAKKRRQVGKNAYLVELLDEFFPSQRGNFTPTELKKLQIETGFGAPEIIRKYIRYALNERPFNAELVADLIHLRQVSALPDEEIAEVLNETGFGAPEIIRKYIRYALNERPFNAELVADLIHLRQVSALPDEEIAEVLNEVSRRIVKQKGAVVMSLEGFTEKGVQRKVAVQAVFSKLLYLSELEEFCSSSVREKMLVKTAFGVTDSDADSLRIQTLSEATDLESWEKNLDSTDADEPGQESKKGGEDTDNEA